MSECFGPDVKHVVTFSSGAGSWAAAKAVAAKHGTDNLYLVFCDVKGDSQEEHSGEDEDNYRFLAEATADVGGTFVRVAEGRDVWQVFEDQRFIGNSRVSNCSRTLKQEISRKWLNENCCPCHTVVYVGIDWSESHRLPAIVRNHVPYKVEAPLCDPPYLTKDGILAELKALGIKPPRLYGMGFAHANCGGFCVRAGQGQFKHLLEVMPERYAYHEGKEEAFRQKIGKDVAILRDRRGGKSTPLTLHQLRLRVQQGEEVDVDDIGGCGCYSSDELELAA